LKRPVKLLLFLCLVYPVISWFGMVCAGGAGACRADLIVTAAGTDIAVHQPALL